MTVFIQRLSHESHRDIHLRWEDPPVPSPVGVALRIGATVLAALRLLVWGICLPPAFLFKPVYPKIWVVTWGMAASAAGDLGRNIGYLAQKGTDQHLRWPRLFSTVSHSFSFIRNHSNATISMTSLVVLSTFFLRRDTLNLSKGLSIWKVVLVFASIVFLSQKGLRQANHSKKYEPNVTQTQLSPQSQQTPNVPQTQLLPQSQQTPYPGQVALWYQKNQLEAHGWNDQLDLEQQNALWNIFCRKWKAYKQSPNLELELIQRSKISAQFQKKYPKTIISPEMVTYFCAQKYFQQIHYPQALPEPWAILGQPPPPKHEEAIIPSLQTIMFLQATSTSG